MNVLKYILLFILLVGIKISVFSQCAMCRAALESDLQSGGSVGKGINHGIIYLMVVPYLIIATVGYFVYKHYKKNKLTNSAQ